MPGYFSLKKSSRLGASGVYADSEKTVKDYGTLNGSREDCASTTALISTLAPLPPPTLKVKRVDLYFDGRSKVWKFRDTSHQVVPDMLRGAPDSDNPWAPFCFVVIRKVPTERENVEPTFQIRVMSPYLRTVCKEVMQDVEGVSWTAEPLELDIQLFISFHFRFVEYHKKLQNAPSKSSEENGLLSTTATLLDYFRKEYRNTLTQIANLTAHDEITYDLLHAVMVPQTVLVTRCLVTGEPRAVRLKSTNRSTGSSGSFQLVCESVDFYDDNLASESILLRRVKFGRAEDEFYIQPFRGTVKINSLLAYPIQYHPAQDTLKKSIIDRGRKWVSLNNVQHMHYKGIASRMITDDRNNTTIKYNVNSRVMIDRASFKRLNSRYKLPAASTRIRTTQALREQTQGSQLPSNPTSLEELSEDDLLLTSPILYGFSLLDKVWLEFNVELLHPIVWNDEAFASLVLPGDRKVLLQSLVEAHDADLGFDDCLVVNLFGPPGVGKTLTAEATSEHVRRPLYMIGGGDLGTRASEMDRELQRVFDVAASWGAIVLIDEADVFLEERSLHDLERNAIVAVFLRHVEYYRGILFLTTNRIKTFDPAFLSRIHVALHFQELSKSAKAQVWRSFLSKVGVSSTDINDEMVAKLAERDINGRQIKNVTRTAHSLALSRGEKLTFAHLARSLNAMEEFSAEFAALSAKT